MRNRLLFTGARLVSVTDESVGIIDDSWLLCEDGVIADSGTGWAPDPGPATRRVDLGGAFLAPGFVSSHSHLFTSVARGLGSGETLHGWADEMHAVTGGASSDDVYWATMHGAFDNLANGITTVFDFIDSRTPRVPIRDDADADAPTMRPLAYVDRQIDAHVDAGIRAVVAVTIEGGGDGGPQAWRDFAHAVEHARASDPRFILDAAVSGAAQRAQDDRFAAVEAEAMRRFGIVNQVHLLETLERLEAQRETFWWYERAGALGPGMIFGHFVHPDESIVSAVAAAGCAVSWQPVADGRLASGTADIPSLTSRGIRVGLGLGDQACSDVSDPWQSMRFALYQSRAASGTTALSPADVLRMQTIGAAEVIGQSGSVGSTMPGAYADLLVVDPRRPDMGPLRAPLVSYVLSSTLRNLREVYVGGELASVAGVARSPLAERASAEVHRRFAV